MTCISIVSSSGLHRWTAQTAKQKIKREEKKTPPVVTRVFLRCATWRLSFAASSWAMTLVSFCDQRSAGVVHAATETVVGGARGCFRRGDSLDRPHLFMGERLVGLLKGDRRVLLEVHPFLLQPRDVAFGGRELTLEFGRLVVAVAKVRGRLLPSTLTSRERSHLLLVRLVAAELRALQSVLFLLESCAAVLLLFQAAVKHLEPV